MERIIVTGASGFIGRNLIPHLVQKGAEVYAIELPAAADRIPKLDNVHILSGDINCYRDLASQLPQKADAMIHLAWIGVVPEARNAVDIQQRNIEMCLNAVRLAKAVDVQRFILPGSTSEYAYNDGPINENALPSPLNAYGAAKLSARYLCQAYCRELQVPYIYTVVTGIYGSDRKDNNVITYAITQLLQKKIPKFTALEQRWDYIHIDDLKEAMYQIATKGKSGTFYTIGHGDNQPLREYVLKIRDLIDPDLPMEIGAIPYQDGRLPSSCVDLTALERDTGFVPRISYRDGIQTVIQQYKEMENH